MRMRLALSVTLLAVGVLLVGVSDPDGFGALLAFIGLIFCLRYATEMVTESERQLRLQAGGMGVFFLAVCAWGVMLIARLVPSPDTDYSATTYGVIALVAGLCGLYTAFVYYRLSTGWLPKRFRGEKDRSSP